MIKLLVASFFALALLFPSASQAAVLYTTPDPASISDCSSTNPCSIEGAVEVAAQPGDTVILESGATYLIDQVLDVYHNNLTIKSLAQRSEDFPLVSFTNEDEGIYITQSDISLQRFRVVGSHNTDPLVAATSNTDETRLTRMRVEQSGGYPAFSATNAIVRNSIIISDSFSVALRSTGLVFGSVIKTNGGRTSAVWNTDNYLDPLESAERSTLNLVNSVIFSEGEEIFTEDALPGGAVPVTRVHNTVTDINRWRVSGEAVNTNVGSSSMLGIDPLLSHVFEQTAASPTIDSGCITELFCNALSGEKDYFGNPRKSGSALDVGAHEADQGPPAISSLRMSSRINRGKALKATFRLWEATSFPVKVTATLRGQGKKGEAELNVESGDMSSRRALSVKTKKKGRAFPSGKYRYRLCAEDAAGNRGSCLKKTVTIKKGS